nr:MAG: ORF1 [Torque teno midi virus]
MPFWWKRRRKPWFGRWRYRKRRYKKYKGRRKRVFRRRNRKPTRRRRRRKYKVRRKKPKIILKQWQPDSIRKCKIKGSSVLIIGAQGTQFRCFTNTAEEYPHPKAPGGGGFGSEIISLKWLYQEYLRHNNIWTHSNQYTDLVRYTGGQITFYRHPITDFIISYDLQPPFILNQYTYPELQPQNMLLAKRKKILLSKQTKTNGRLKLKIKFKPPKQMTTKWFFQKDFCPYGLIRISAAAADFNYSRIGWSAQSQVSTLYALNTEFYQISNWAQSTGSSRGYVNIATQQFPLWFKFVENKQTKWYCYDPDDETKKKYQDNPYFRSVSYYDGFFNPRILFSSEVRAGGNHHDKNKTVYTEAEFSTVGSTQLIAQLPLIPLRYNPNADHGHGNCIYLASVFQGRYNKPSISTNLVFNNVPLWMAAYGNWDFILQHQADKGIYLHNMFVVQSDALETLNQTTKQTIYPLVDSEYCQGKLPWDEYLGETAKQFWYPTAEWQKGSLNTLVCSGPYVPKYNDQKGSTWELPYTYKFFFKWGGPQVTDPQVEDPCTRNKYPVPDTLQKTVQITNPEKLHTASLLHEWDFRRGFVTSTALKRMSEHLETDTDFQSDDSETTRKKRRITKEIPCKLQKEEKIKECLLSLCEEPTCQEETQDLHKLIKQQQQQQQHLRKNILKLMTYLKKSQTCVELQTGLLE